MREAAAYNQNIYLMVSLPYVLLGTVGFMIYRQYRQRERHIAAWMARHEHFPDVREGAHS